MIIEYLDSGLIIFLLGIIAINGERLRRDVCKLKKVGWKNHPDDMK